MTALKFYRRYLTLACMLVAGLALPIVPQSCSQAATISSIYAFGSASDGQFGNGLTTSNSSNTPAVTTLSNAVKVVAGFDQGFAITNDGRLLSWGSNNSGQLGLGLVDQNPHPQPGYVVGPTRGELYLTNVTDVAAGAGFALAVTSDGAVWGWGSNSNGQLGQNASSLEAILRPVQIKGLDKIKVVAVGASALASFALAEDGTLYSWGNNLFGTLGTGDYSNHYTATKVIFADGGVKIRAMAFGNAHALALDTKNNLWAWGSNESGQLGNGTTTSFRTPQPILHNIDKIVAGAKFSLALTLEGQVYAWGNDSYFQLGDNDSSRAAKSTPQLVPGLSEVVQIAAGADFGLAVTKDGLVYAWGNSLNGQAGPTFDPGDYTLHLPLKINSLSRIQSVTAGRNFTLAIPCPDIRP